MVSAFAVLVAFWAAENTTAWAATNSRPVAVADGTYTVVQGGTISVSAPGVLANDTDADGEVLTTVLVNGAAQGTVSLGRDGSFNYRAPANYVGEDGFSYVANDGHTVSLRAAAKLRVVPPSAVPGIAIVCPQNDAAVYTGDFNVIASASDSDGTVTNVQFLVNDVPFANVANAPFYLAMSNTPAGQYRFVAIATDNDGLSSTSAPVQIEVFSGDPIPSAQPINPQITAIKPVNAELMEVQFTSQVGGIYFVQCSEDFVHWKTDSTALVGAGPTMAVAQRRMGDNCFYRILRIP